MIRPPEGGVQLLQLPWGLSPARPKGRAVINVRSEGRNFTRGRCLVPASHYFEFTGPRARRRAGALRKPARIGSASPVSSDGDGPDGNPVEAFTLLTTGPGPDVAPYHNRQRVILERAEWAAWLTSSEPPRDLLVPSPPGSLEVRECQAKGSAWMPSRICLEDLRAGVDQR